MSVRISRNRMTKSANRRIYCSAIMIKVCDGMFGFADSIYEKAEVCSCDEVNHLKDLRFDNYPVKK
jgi:hypothetical protein